MRPLALSPTSEVLVLLVVSVAFVGLACRMEMDPAKEGFRCDPGDFCEHGLQCINGRCVRDPCETLECAPDEICVLGHCYPSHCEDRPCPEDAICKQGECVFLGCIGATCPPGKACAGGECLPVSCSTRLCGPDEVCDEHLDLCLPTLCVGRECPSGRRCAAHGFCVPVDCPYRSCDHDEVCDVDDRTCVTPSCYDSSCDEDEQCVRGECAPRGCAHRWCPEGFVCLEEECIAAECIGLECPPSHACAAGECWPMDCEDVQCDRGVCVYGSCVERSCVGVECVFGETCANAECYPAHCTDPCTPEEVCVEDECVETECVGFNCPPGTVCSEGHCLERCRINGVVYAPGEPSDESDCLLCMPEDATSSWTAAPEGTRCTTGEHCIVDMECDAEGACVGGEPLDCSHLDAPCIAGECNEELRQCIEVSLPKGAPCGMHGVCDHTGECLERCLIDDRYFADGSPNPSSPCQLCQAEQSLVDWTNEPAGTSCGENEVCDGLGVCAEGCELPWSEFITHGESVTAFSHEIVDCGDTCPSEIRECAYGVLSGTYENESCTENCADCETENLSWGEHDCQASISALDHGAAQSLENTMEGREGVATFICNDGAWELQANSSCVADECPLPWGESIHHGESVPAYEAETVECGETCVSEIRECQFGVLSGSLTHVSCLEDCSGCETESLSWSEHDCEALFPSTDHDESITRENAIDGRTGTAAFSCNDGAWELQPGSSCSAHGCPLPWGGTLNHGESAVAYEHEEVACEAECPSEVRTCEYGDLSGSYLYSECLAPCASCSSQDLSWGEHACEASFSSMEHGGSQSLHNTVEGREGIATFFCNDGSWELHPDSSCTADGCPLPWGGGIEHGEYVVAYEHESTECGDGCPSETRECYYGELSGSYQYASCTELCGGCPARHLVWGDYDCEASFSAANHGAEVSRTNALHGRTGSATYLCDDSRWELQPGSSCVADECDLPWGGTIAHGEIVTAYEQESVECQEECSSEQRECRFGILSGSHTLSSCVVLCEDCPAETLAWGDHGCEAHLMAAEHGVSRNEYNTVEGLTGQATFICDDGLWEKESASCQPD